MWVYMMVTLDEYQLPLAIADSATELARLVNANIKTVTSSASHVKSGKIKNSRFYRVEIEDDDE